ncbi:TetR/AcrR family transcriptional regulator [Cellulosimicrobium cellulans]|uniref:TetR/AcrR family transcriptional regulator n=1 Tax=Cellulosimicrobium cellulans TaxID=1710 RepID=UPI00381D57E3
MPRDVDHDQRRREIVLAVWTIVARRGIEGVTLRGVAAEAGVSMGRVQHYFGTRDELVRHACRLMVEGARAEHAAQGEAMPPVERLRLLVHRAVPTTPGFTLGVAVWTAFHAKSVDDPEIATILADAHRGGVREGVALVSEARERGDLPDGEDADALALRLLALAEGYGTRVLVGSLDAADALAALDREIDRIGGAPTAR